MDKYAYQRAHMSRRRKYPSGGVRNTRRRSRLLSFILACAGIFVFAVGINYLFPHFSKALGDKVSTVVDYRSAFATIGEGISGEKKLGDALTEAWAEAFNLNDETVPANGTVDTPEITNAMGEAPPESNELSDALVAAFADSQLGDSEPSLF